MITGIFARHEPAFVGPITPAVTISSGKAPSLSTFNVSFDPVQDTFGVKINAVLVV